MAKKTKVSGGFSPPKDKYPELMFLRKELGMEDEEFVSWLENAILAAIGQAAIKQVVADAFNKARGGQYGHLGASPARMRGGSDAQLAEREMAIRRRK